MKENPNNKSWWSHIICAIKVKCKQWCREFGRPKMSWGENYKRWCREFGIPEEQLGLKFWRSGQYKETRDAAIRLKEAEKLPIPKPPKLN